MPTIDTRFCVHHRWDVNIYVDYDSCDIEATCLVCQHGVFKLWDEEIGAVLRLAEELAPERLAVILAPHKQRADNEHSSEDSHANK